MPKYKIEQKRFCDFAREAYNTINQITYNSELPQIVIKVCHMEQLNGDYEPGAIFRINSTGKAEHISICFSSQIMAFDNLNMFLYQTIEYLAHEMIHVYCYLHEINDCDYTTQFHNYRFKEISESHGLICTYDPQYGFCETQMTDELYLQIIRQVFKPAT